MTVLATVSGVYGCTPKALMVAKSTDPLRNGPAVAGAVAPAGGGSGTAPRVLATADDVDALFALFVAGDTVYYTGGRVVSVPPDGPAGSDVRGIVRSVSRAAQTPVDLWTGQGYAAAIAVAAEEVYFLTHDYGSQGRAGQLHRLSLNDGSTAIVRSWLGQGSSVGIAPRGSAVYWSYTSGSGGSVLLTTGTNTTVLSDSTYPSRGQIAVGSVGDVFWLSGPASIVSFSANSGSRSWKLDNDVRALAINDRGDRIFVATSSGLVELDPETHVPQVLLRDIGYVTSLEYRNGCLYWTSSPDWSSHFEGSVSAMSERGGPVAILASSQGYPQSLAVDAAGLYWVNRDARQVMMLATSAASSVCQP